MHDAGQTGNRRSLGRHLSFPRSRVGMHTGDFIRVSASVFIPTREHGNENNIQHRASRNQDRGWGIQYPISLSNIRHPPSNICHPASKGASMEASYIAAYRDGRLHEAIRRASLWMRKCTLCPRLCKVDRMSDEKGYCGRAGGPLSPASPAPRRGAPPGGQERVRTIFFSHCNLFCVFCQNYDISHGARGRRRGRMNWPRSCWRSSVGDATNQFRHTVARNFAHTGSAPHCGRGRP